MKLCGKSKVKSFHLLSKFFLLNKYFLSTLQNIKCFLRKFFCGDLIHFKLDSSCKITKNIENIHNTKVNIKGIIVKYKKIENQQKQQLLYSPIYRSNDISSRIKVLAFVAEISMVVLRISYDLSIVLYSRLKLVHFFHNQLRKILNKLSTK